MLKPLHAQTMANKRFQPLSVTWKMLKGIYGRSKIVEPQLRADVRCCFQHYRIKWDAAAIGDAIIL